MHNESNKNIHGTATDIWSLSFKNFTDKLVFNHTKVPGGYI